MRCLYREQITISGSYVDVDVYPVFAPAGKRRKKYKPTSEVQQIVNDRNKKMKLARLLNANFSRDDYTLTLTYRPEEHPEDDEECGKRMKNFLRRLRRAMKRVCRELKYVCVTERSTRGRYHHHLVINGGLTMREVQECWSHGLTNMSPLVFDDETGIMNLAQYMCKETVGYKSFTTSRNLVQPTVIEKTGRVSARDVRELAQYTDCSAEFTKLYPEYEFKSAFSLWNPENKYYYIRAFMRLRS